MQADTEQLVTRAAAGDTAAFGELIRRHKASVHAYVLSRVGDFHCAEDVAQETFIAAFAGLARLRDPGKFPAWLHGIADNLCALWLRRTLRDRSAKPSAAARTRETNTTTPDIHSDETILEVIARLCPHDAAAVTLYYCDGLRQRECAEFLGVSHKAFESRLYRARRKLRQEVIHMAKRTLKDHCPGDSFDEAVLGEIRRLVAVVGAECKKAPAETARQRLGVLFARSQGRLSDLIRNAATDVERRAAMRMVRTLGREGVDLALTLILADERAVRLNALAAVPMWDQGAFTYTVMEAVHEASFSDEQKIAVLIDLIRRPALLADAWPRAQRKRAAYDSTIYMEMLLRRGPDAMAALAQRIRDACEAGEKLDNWLARTAVRFGSQIAPVVRSWADTGSDRLTLAAMKLAGTLGDGLYQFHRWQRSRPGRIISEGDTFLLFRGQTAPVVHPSRIDPAAMADLGRCVARAAGHKAREVRIAAAGAMGHFDDAQAVPILAQAMAGDDAQVGVAAARSLGRRLSPARVPPLVRALETANIAVKRSANNALTYFWAAAIDVALPWTFESGGPTSLTTPVVDPGPAPDYGQALADVLDENRDRIIAALTAAGLGTNPWDVSTLADRMAAVAEARRQRAAWRDDSQVHRRAREYHAQHPEVLMNHDTLFDVHLAAIMRVIPEDRDYREKELTRIISGANSQYSSARRDLCDSGWMSRPGGVYRLTELGRTAWRMERLLACADD